MTTLTKNPTTRAALAATANFNSRWFAGMLAGSSLLGAPLALAVDNLWTGAVNSDYNIPGNWSLERVPAFPNGQPPPDDFDDAIINTLTNFPILSADQAARPRDIRIGSEADTTGRLDHRSGNASTGEGNWMYAGVSGGTGTYNLANTAGTGGTFTGFAIGSGNLTVGGTTNDARFYIGGDDAGGDGGTGTVNVNTSGTLSMTNDLSVGAQTGTGVFNLDNGTVTSGSVAAGAWTFIGQEGGTGTLNMSGGSISSFGRFYVGRNGAANGTVNMTGGTITKETGEVFAVAEGSSTGVFNQSGGTVSAGDGEFWVGQAGGSTGTYNLSGSGTLNVNNWVAIGRNGGNGTFNMDGGTFNKTGGGNFIVSDHATAVLTQTDGTINTNGCEVWVGSGGTGTGTYTMEGGTLNVSNWLAIGREGPGVLNQSGGIITKTGAGGTSIGNFNGGSGIATVSGGLLDVQTGDLFVGEGGNLSGTLTISGDGEVNSPQTRVGTNGTVVGTLNLDGGTLRTGFIDGGGSGTSNINFNGTQIVATATAAGFIANFDSATVEAGGVRVDTNGSFAGINQALLTDGGSGGLIKSGTGVLYLNGTNTYTGATSVTEGTLGGTGSIAGAVTLAAGADLNPGVTAGVLTAASVNYTGAGTFTIDTDDSALVPADRLDVTGNLNITNAELVVTTDLTSRVYIIAKYGSLTGSAFTNVSGLTAGYTVNYAFNGNQIALTRPATAFDNWVDPFFPANANDPAFVGPNADPDNDGTANSVEFALGGNPASGADGPKVYAITADGSDEGTARELLLTIAVRNGTPAFDGSPSPMATTAGFTYTIEGSFDLADFSRPVSVVSPVTTDLPDVPEGYEYRTFSLNGTDGLASPRGFMRVQVTP